MKNPYSVPMWVTTLLYSAVVLSIRRSAGHTTVKLCGHVGAWDRAGSRSSKRPRPRAVRWGVHLSAVSDDHPTSGWFIVSQKRGIRRTVVVCLAMCLVVFTRVTDMQVRHNFSARHNQLPAKPPCCQQIKLKFLWRGSCALKQWKNAWFYGCFW